MENPEQTTPKSARLKIVIIILTVLLVISAGGLAARYLYLYFSSPAQMTATVPDNLIDEEPESPSGETTSASEDKSPVFSDADGAGTNAASGVDSSGQALCPDAGAVCRQAGR